jgi:RecA/RadA recombinase
MANIKDLQDKIRNGINKKLERPVARQLLTTEELTQVDAWIDMGGYFQKAVGGKGFPCGHITQVVGDSDTGKTTLVMEGMISTQRSGGLVYLIDSEHKFHFGRFALMGGVAEDITTISVDSLEQAWNAFFAIVEQVLEVKKKNPDLKVMIAWDSVAASVPDAVLQAEAEDMHVSVEAKINNKEIRKARQAIKKSGISAVFINHTYWTMPKFGPPKEVLKGGTEMFYMSTLILKTKRKSWLERQSGGLQQRYGTRSLLEVFKGHLGGTKTTTEFYIVDKGILSTDKEFEKYKEGMDE